MFTALHCVSNLAFFAQKGEWWFATPGSDTAVSLVCPKCGVVSAVRTEERMRKIGLGGQVFGGFACARVQCQHRDTELTLVGWDDAGKLPAQDPKGDRGRGDPISRKRWV